MYCMAVRVFVVTAFGKRIDFCVGSLEICECAVREDTFS